MSTGLALYLNQDGNTAHCPGHRLAPSYPKPLVPKAAGAWKETVQGVMTSLKEEGPEFPLLSGLKDRHTQLCLNASLKSGEEEAGPVWLSVSLPSTASCEGVFGGWMGPWTPRSSTFLGKLWKNKKVGGGRRGGSRHQHLAVQGLAAHTHLRVLEICQVWQLALRNWGTENGREAKWQVIPPGEPCCPPCRGPFLLLILERMLYKAASSYKGPPAGGYRRCLLRLKLLLCSIGKLNFPF